MKDIIKIAAVEEISERGIKFTMTDLAKRIGVSKRCLYQHFTSKEDLISSLVDGWLEDVLKKRKEILAGNDSYEEKLKSILCGKPAVMSPTEGRIAYEIKRFMPSEWKRIDHFMNEHWAVIEEFLRLGIEKGYFRPVYLPVLQKMVRGSINEIIDYHFLMRNNVSLMQAKMYMVDILLYGLTTR